MNEKPTIEVGKVPIITKFIYTLGVLPTSYLMSMTYQEQVTWLCNYIQTTLIPQINEDVEAIQELQNLYELLRTYVNNEVQSLEDFINNFFNNLDVQEEIDRKLDIMASNGTLAQIIEDYATIPELTTRVQTLESNDKNTIICIGDSYGDGNDSSSRTYWPNRLCQSLHKNKVNYCEGSAGFARTGNRGHNFNDEINLAYNDTSFDNNDVDKIIVYGGYNDFAHRTTYTPEIFKTAVETFLDNAITKYPNATIIVFGINYPHAPVSGNAPVYPHDYSKIIEELCREKGVSYGDSTAWLYQYDDVLFEDNVHPNLKGTSIIISKMLSYFYGIQTNKLIYSPEWPTSPYAINQKISYKQLTESSVAINVSFQYGQNVGNPIQLFQSRYKNLNIKENEIYPIYKLIDLIPTVVGYCEIRTDSQWFAYVNATYRDLDSTYYIKDVIYSMYTDSTDRPSE